MMVASFKSLKTPTALREPILADGNASVPPGTTTENLDRISHRWLSRFTGGGSPRVVAVAFMDRVPF
jgi:hypothetical protein